MPDLSKLFDAVLYAITPSEMPTDHELNQDRSNNQIGNSGRGNNRGSDERRHCFTPVAEMAETFARVYPCLDTGGGQADFDEEVESETLPTELEPETLWRLFITAGLVPFLLFN